MKASVFRWANCPRVGMGRRALPLNNGKSCFLITHDDQINDPCGSGHHVPHCE